uniref:Uncharacterized protein n=1 Tax=Pararge aegeria TaxID=116150 RepID=S4PS01_9NEOP
MHGAAARVPHQRAPGALRAGRQPAVPRLTRHVSALQRHRSAAAPQHCNYLTFTECAKRALSLHVQSALNPSSVVCHSVITY